MRLPISLLMLLLGLPLAATAAGRYTPDLQDLDRVPTTRVDSIVIEKALATPPKSQALRFAVAIPQTLGLDNGHWRPLDGDTLSWRARVQSGGAKSLNFTFNQLSLPPHAQLWIYDAQGVAVQGPYTAADLHGDGRFWTPIVPGDDAVLEVQAPSAEARDVQLSLAAVNYGYTDIAKSTTSTTCMIDFACTGSTWDNQSRAVAMIQIGGTTYCSGQLINNTRQDGTPLFLTANHCGIGGASSPAASVVFYWNYRGSVCGLLDGSLLQNQVGATLLTNDSTADMALLQLFQKPPAAYNLYYAGWNASGATPLSGATIGHPSTLQDKVAVFSSPAAATPVTITTATPIQVNAWQVVWSSGVTAGGSSGGALWDQNHALVGVLSGGNSSCATPQAPDYFARLDYAWNAANNNAVLMKAAMDPTATGCSSVPGYDPNAPGAALSSCNGLPPPSSNGGSTATPTSSASSGGGGGALDLSLLTVLLAGFASRSLMRRRRAS